MSDMTPQNVFGFDEAQLRRLIREEYAARDRGPGRIWLAFGYAFERGKETSSWAGLCGLLALLAPNLPSDFYPNFVQIGAAVCGLAAIVFKDRLAPGGQGQ